MSTRELKIPVEGGQMHVTVDGAGEPVLLVHGIFASGYCWRHVAARLASDYTVYTVDLLGFGKSDMPPDADYSQSAQARRIHQVIEHLQLTHVRLVGHSMGGEISVIAVRENPEPIQQLALISADGFRPPFKNWQRKLLSGTWMSWFVRHTFDEKWFRRTIGTIAQDKTLFTSDVIEQYVMPYRRSEFPHAMRKLALDREGGFTPDSCRAIELPTLLLWGDSDLIVPRRIGDTYHALWPHAAYKVCTHCGHLPMEENPAWLVEQLQLFFQEGREQAS